MTTANVTLRIDKSLKEEADELFNSLGMSFTTAVNIFIRKALATKSIPFEVGIQDEMTGTQHLLETLNTLLASQGETAKGIPAISADSSSSYPSITSMAQVEKLVEASRAS